MYFTNINLLGIVKKKFLLIIKHVCDYYNIIKK